ncbi:MAG: PEP-CTERM sorting domain-containing protein, partial [Gemmataceae bacterium]
VVRFDQRHSNTASRFQRLEYTTDGTNWVSAGVFETNAGATTWYNNRTVDLSGVAGANNNANFGVRIVSIFDPANNTSYSAAQPGSTYGTAGTIRYDAVTISAGSVWIGGSGTDLSTAANYSGGVAPASTGTGLFGSAGGSNTSVSTSAGGNSLDQVIFQAGASAYTVSGTGTLTLRAGVLNNATAPQTISAPITFGNQNAVYNTGTLTLSGAIGFTNQLWLQGGVTHLGGAVTGTGAVRVIGGTLNAGGTINAPVSVMSGGSLVGTGTVGGNVTVAAGGTIRGDSGAGTGNLNVTTGLTSIQAATTNGANLATQLAVSGGAITGNSKLALTGASTNLAFDMTTGKFRITLLGDAGLTTGNTYTIALATATAATNFYRNGSNTDPFTTADFDVVSGSGTWTAFNSVSLVRNAGTNSLDLTFSPVPEPATVGLIAAGVLAAGTFVRRKLRPTAM